ncbi:hypothetical protein J6U78_03105 [bacterium]|nr:hypothetical protein [bacterium]
MNIPSSVISSISVNRDYPATIQRTGFGSAHAVIIAQKEKNGNSIKITVLLWKRTMKMKARAAILGKGLKIWADP